MTFSRIPDQFFANNVKTKTDIPQSKMILRKGEDLTTRNAQLLRLAREEFGHKNVWTTDGRIFVYDQVTKKKQQFSSSNEEVAETTVDYLQVD